LELTSFERGTFKSTLIKTFCPSRLTILAKPSTLSFARSAPVTWKKREEITLDDLRVVRERADAAKENIAIE
jgi:hypothetical protein